MERCLAALLIWRLVKALISGYQGLFICPEIKWPGFVPDRLRRRPGRKRAYLHPAFHALCNQLPIRLLKNSDLFCQEAIFAAELCQQK
jgi:hypothetical protein